jgi:hypothetical protein
MADPTNARMRALNSFFDAPRFPIKTLSGIPEPVPAPAAPPAAAPAAIAPALTLGLAPRAKRTVRGFLSDGLLVKVTASRPIVDVEARLFEVLSTGLRPLGASFRVEPGPRGASLRVEPTRFARSKLARAKGAHQVQLVVTAIGRDGAVGSQRSVFELR